MNGRTLIAVRTNVMHTLRPRSVMVGLVGLLVLAAWGSAQAQMQPASAELVRAVGRVDVMPKGQATWSAASVGARLVEGDQIRALAGGAADLTLPDGSTILVAENSRFAVTKLDYDAASRDRDASFHVVAGKVRAQVSQAAVSLVRAGQSNFNISTPNGVAAIRGTVVISTFNPATQETVAYVFPSPGQSPASARVTFVNHAGQSATITAGQFVRQLGNQPLGAPTLVGTLPAAVPAALQTAQNVSTQGTNQLLVRNVILPTAEQTQNVVDTVLRGPGTIVPALQTISNPPGTTTGGCSGCGQDVVTTPKPASAPDCRKQPESPWCQTGARFATRLRPPVCASPPCD